MLHTLYANALDVAMDIGRVYTGNNAPVSLTAIAGDDVSIVGMVARHGATTISKANSRFMTD